MAGSEDTTRKTTLDKDLDKLARVGEAASFVSRRLVAPGLALLFLALVAFAVSIVVGGAPGAVAIVAAAAIGGYMALNIGANDVANNVSPAVGARALTMGGALALAAAFEIAGALIAGDAVVETVSHHIIDPTSVAGTGVFVTAMMAALLAAAVWVNAATAIGAPVSTTHSIVAGVMGAGIAAAGFGAVDWAVVGRIAASWAVSPVLSAVVAAVFLGFIKENIVYREDKIAAARRWVPLLIAVMGGSFAAFVVMEAVEKRVDVPGYGVAAVGVISFLLVWRMAHVRIARHAATLDNRNQSLRKLFRLPLIVSAALLSFAHGANDVANAVGPLAAIVRSVHSGAVADVVAVPFWVLFIGALGISLGILLFGRRLVRMVGERITKLNPMRAFCVALATALTVILAAWLGLPVSSTHTAVGAVFGVGFFREWYTAHSTRRRAHVERKHQRQHARRIDAKGSAAEFEVKAFPEPVSREEIRRRKLVRRAHFTTIVAAWVVTVPATATMAALMFGVLELLR